MAGTSKLGFPRPNDFSRRGLKFFPPAPIVAKNHPARQITALLDFGNVLSENGTVRDPLRNSRPACRFCPLTANSELVQDDVSAAETAFSFKKKPSRTACPHFGNYGLI
jgi:adenine-specific DNA glycosylase